jgi:hypothetical protein
VSGTGANLQRSSSAACAICQAAALCAPAIVRSTADLLENCRAHLLVAFVIGLRRDPVPMCDSCKGKMEALFAQIARASS